MLLSADSVLAQQEELDQRIHKHYTQVQIDEILQQDPHRIRELNFYFRSSFRIIPPVGMEKAEIDPSEVDVRNFERHRLMDQRAKVGLSRDGHVIELLSYNELEAIYKQLREQE